MPIEFTCDSCSKMLRVPDGSEGKSCKCPSCGQLLSIPDPHAILPIESLEEPEESLLQIPCPRCQHLLMCEPNLLGTKGQCKSCQQIFLISTDPKERSRSLRESGLVFTCPKCQQLFDGKEEMKGRKGKCHACGEVFVIELRRADLPKPQHPISPSPSKKSQAPLGSTPSQASSIPRSPAPKRTQPAIPTQSTSESAPLSSGLPSMDPLWTDLGDFSNQTISSNPYGVQGNSFQTSPKRGSRLPSGRDGVVYILPGIFSIMIALVGIMYLLGTLALNSIILFAGRDLKTEVYATVIGNLVHGVIGIVLSIFVILGGIAMIRRRGLGLAKTAAIILCIPCSCFILGLPLGIWSCVVLFSSKAHRDFS